MGLSQGADSGDDENWPDNIHSLKVRQMRFSNWLDLGQERKGRWGVTLGRLLWSIKRVALPSTDMETNGAVLQGYWSEVPFWIYFLRYWWVLLVEILGRQKIEATGSKEFCCKGKPRNGVVNGRDGGVSRKLWFHCFKVGNTIAYLYIENNVPWKWKNWWSRREGGELLGQWPLVGKKKMGSSTQTEGLAL